MKKLHLTLLLALLYQITNAQIVDEIIESGYNNNSINLQIRHLKGMASIDVQYGYSGHTNFINVGYGNLITDKLNFNVLLNYEFGKIQFTNVDYKNVIVGVGYTPFKINNTFFFTLTGGVLSGFIKATNKEINKTETKFNPGIYGGLNIETYLFNKLSLVLKAEQQYNISDPFGYYHYQLGAGLKFYFY